MSSVRTLLTAKAGATLTVPPSTPVMDALRQMREHNVGSLVVCDAGRLVGLFAERHLAHSVAERGPACVSGTVADLMEESVLYVQPDAHIDECMALMTERRTRHLPVLDEGQLVGIVSIGDVVKALVSDKDFEIEQLERYISGR